MFRINLQQALFAICALLSGILVYLFVRPQASSYFVIGFLEPLNIPVFPSLLFADQLPSFLHTYAFILMTYLVLGLNNPKVLRSSILLWLVVELLFEFAQITTVALYLITLTPEWFSQFIVLELIDSFFLNGTYDVFDVLAIFLAAIAAGLTVQASWPREDYDDEY